MTQAKLTISEVAAVLGIAAKTIRHYHEIGVLAEPERGDNGYRLYSGADLGKIRTIRELQAFGLSLRQIKFILDTDEPDFHLRAFLMQRDGELADEIYRLQQQQARVRAFLNGEINPAARTPAQDILHSVIKPVSSGLADVLIEVESQVLSEIDRLPHDDTYTRIWEHVAASFARSMQPHEHLLILWLERYLALANMTPEDLQARAWLQELRSTASASVLRRALDLPPSDALPLQEQLQLRQLLPLLLYEQATPLQQAFLAAVLQGAKR